MDLRQLRYFLQIADSGSLSRAAEVLHVAQPSLSQHVRSLEEELGVELLARHPRGVTATEYGRLLCDHVRVILRDVERAREAMHDAVGSPGGEVVLGLPTTVCRGMTVPLVNAVQRRFPRINLHLVEAMTGSLDEWMQTGKIDVALLYDRKAFENIVANDVMVEELKLILPAGHARAGLRAISFNEATALPLVLPARPHVLREVVETFAARAGTEPHIAMNCDSLQGIIALVGDGYASVYPSFALRDEIRRGELVAIPIVDPTPKWRVSIVLARRNANSRAAEAIAGLVDEVARSLVVDGSWDAQLRRLTDPR
ncbi:LysR family transcriptional regulator [Aureimonas sp. SA4125]|uniref:LysR family transcriptional regulator n=1 Tax=Aureimonas sp. SA4125 TaxID=2826993 RepID=UPI001CC52742|nr:LysR family transcriptional regulator [Aureimonas sp. SA4125]BDA84886.1 LysR family transcriptional regulator [Aureimonas sp. SA4125]